MQYSSVQKVDAAQSVDRQDSAVAWTNFGNRMRSEHDYERLYEYQFRSAGQRSVSSLGKRKSAGHDSEGAFAYEPEQGDAKKCAHQNE